MYRSSNSTSQTKFSIINFFALLKKYVIRGEISTLNLIYLKKYINE